MTAQWHVRQLDQALGPLGWDQLVDLLQRGYVVGDAMVCGPGVPWTRARDVDSIAFVLAERDERAGWRVTSGFHTPLPAVPEPPPGEAWFFPFSPFLAGVLYVVSFGFYGFVWHYHHVRWLRRRAGLATIPPTAIVRDNNDLRLEIARATDRVDVPRSFRLRPRGASDVLGPLAALYCCPPAIPVLVFYWAVQLADLQKDANRVNLAVAPGTKNRLPGVGEVATVLMALFCWGIIAAGFALEFMG